VSVLEDAVVSVINADEALDELIDGRLYHLTMPPGEKQGCIVYQWVSSPELEIDYYTRPRLQLACWAPTYDDAVELADAARAAFYNTHTTISGVHFRSWVTDTYGEFQDPDTGMFRRIVDVRFDYRRPVETGS
jgi:hypothetical protein